ncbi:MAG: lipopolysaccharide transport periplasmic protein LptA [Pseudomonadota bacterium]
MTTIPLPSRHVISVLLFAMLAAHSPLTLGLRSDAQQPIHIEGDDVQIDQNQELIIYTGSVVAIQGSLQVRGERMVVNVKDNQVERITTKGSPGAPASYRQQLDDNQGRVDAQADSIVYHTGRERVYLNGSATLQQQGNRLTGESIRYDMVNGKVDASAGSGKGRVGLTFDPQTRQQAAESDADPDPKSTP